MPFIAGRGAGAWVNRRLRAPRVRLAVLVALCALPIASCALPAPSTWVSVYDHLLIATLFALGVALSERPGQRPWISRASQLPTLAVTLIGGAFVEFVASGIPRPAIDSGSPAQAHFLFRRVDRDVRCRAVFPDDYPGGSMSASWRGIEARSGRTRVMHVGDSMLSSFRAVLFTHQLQDADHINLGMGGLAADTYPAVIRAWAPRLHPDKIVVHIFLGNDLNECATYLCCDSGPFVAFDARGNATPRCESPRWSDDRALRWQIGPSPYALRVLGHFSIAAAHITERLERSMRPPPPTPYQSGSFRFGWENVSQEHRIETLLRRIRDEAAAQRVPLTLVLIPSRRYLVEQTPDDPTPQIHAMALAATRRLGIRTFDAWNTFEDAVRHPAPDLWFSPDNVVDPHFGDAGHRLYAEWLRTTVFEPRAPLR